MLYIHIPFCKQACYYCDFHFSTNLGFKSDLIKAIAKEIFLQKDYLQTNALDSIYLGGGTPSILNYEELTQLFETINKCFSIDECVEITLEANPDDLDIDKLKFLKSIGINRLSIGIQSFNEKNLKFLNRIHTSREAQDAVYNAKSIGIEDISIDLIYGIHTSDLEVWENDIDQALILDVDHISAYCLTIEQKTVFGSWLQKNKIKSIDDTFAQNSFEVLYTRLFQNAYEHYEVSNFAREKKYAKHNSSYWQNKNYLGVGPGAHSYKDNTRQYNILNNAKYVQSISEEIIPCTVETLTEKDRLNEYIMTSLRTMWGCDLKIVEENFGLSLLSKRNQEIRKQIQNNFLRLDDNKLFITRKGVLMSDMIASELFFI